MTMNLMEEGAVSAVVGEFFCHDSHYSNSLWSRVKILEKFGFKTTYQRSKMTFLQNPNSTSTSKYEYLIAFKITMDEDKN